LAKPTPWLILSITARAADGRMIDRSPRTPELQRSPQPEFNKKNFCA
jgi:hypothetical protein